ncbi:hypothetical protein G6F37_013595 [Rhizopus arrhizus]|nr:hypothetical protein G6F37_013595 [Rhizopus arrhizus]
MIQYYRRFIPALSEILSPLNELKKKGVAFKWGEEQQISFDHCKKLLISEPVLAHPDFNRTFVLYTDASDIGIGGVLSQESLETANVLHPIYFGSKALTEPEKNLSVYEREFLAVVYFIHFFKVYLMGKRFIVYTDQKALQYLKKFNEDSSAKIVRWLSSLLAYDFDIKYRPGKLNSNADALSRLPEEVSQGLEFEEVIEDNYLPLYTAVLEERSKRLKSDSDTTSAPDLSKNRKEQERTRLDKEIALFNKKMILYLYFSYTDNISCHGLIINEYDITDDK